MQEPTEETRVERDVARRLLGLVTVLVLLFLLRRERQTAVLVQSQGPTKKTKSLLYLVRYSLFGILLCLLGMASGSSSLTFVSHVIYTTSLLLASHVFESKEDLTFLLLLSLFTLGSRRWKGYCILSKARDSEATKEGKYDLLYTYPLLVASYKLLKPKLNMLS